MKSVFDNNAIWNEAAKAGMKLGALTVGCLVLKELTSSSKLTFLIQVLSVVLWVVQFFGCILIMKRHMGGLKDRYDSVKMDQSRVFGRRTALLSGLILASAQALFAMQMPQDGLESTVAELSAQMNLSSADMDRLGRVVDNLPVYLFFFQWLYCFLYGTVLSSFLSRYIFIQKMFGDGMNSGQDTTDQQ